MPESGKRSSGRISGLLPWVLLAAGILLVAFAGLFPQLSGDDRDLILSGGLELQSSQASASSSSSSKAASSSSKPASSSKAASSSSKPASSSKPSTEVEPEPLGDAGTAEVRMAALIRQARSNPSDAGEKMEPYPQFPEVPGACEVASMVAVLRSLGFDVTAPAFCDECLLVLPGAPDMVHGFSGSPYEQGAAFPPVMVRAGNAYLRSQDSNLRFVERSGESFDDLMALVDEGWPVLVWTTMGCTPAEHTNTFADGYEWYANEHCVVAYGRAEEGRIKVMDPLDGMVEQDATAFKEVYEDCGKHAVALAMDVEAPVDEYEEQLDKSLSEASSSNEEGAASSSSAPVAEEREPAAEG